MKVQVLKELLLEHKSGGDVGLMLKRFAVIELSKLRTTIEENMIRDITDEEDKELTVRLNNVTDTLLSKVDNDFFGKIPDHLIEAVGTEYSMLLKIDDMYETMDELEMLVNAL